MTSLLTWNQLALGCIIKKPRQVSDFRSIQIEFFADKVEREQAKRSRTNPVDLVWKPADPAQREAGRRHSFDCNVMPHLFPEPRISFRMKEAHQMQLPSAYSSLWISGGLCFARSLPLNLPWPIPWIRNDFWSEALILVVLFRRWY